MKSGNILVLMLLSGSPLMAAVDHLGNLVLDRWPYKPVDRVKTERDNHIAKLESNYKRAQDELAQSRALFRREAETLATCQILYENDKKRSAHELSEAWAANFLNWRKHRAKAIEKTEKARERFEKANENAQKASRLLFEVHQLEEANDRLSKVVIQR